MAKAAQPWKEAATLLIAARTKPKLSGITKPISAISRKVLEETNYKIMVLKRSSNSKFMPNAYVFPGGILNEIDYSEKWAGLFTDALGLKHGTKLSTTNLGLSGIHSKVPAPMYHINYVSPLPNEAIFRICAIRETFEESGVLLCINEKEFQTSRSSGVIHKPIKLSPEKQKLLSSLQKEVNSDEHKFLELCKDLRVIPDIWGLVEHSNWLTPTSLKSNASRRYDTAFFMSFLTEELDYEHDNNEVTDAQWKTPAELLLDFRRGNLLLFPPQVLTLCELLMMTSWSELATASLERLKRENISRIFPVRTGYKDGTASLIKGDYQYPENPDFDGTEPAVTVDSFLADARKPGAPLQRFELRGTFHGIFVDNMSDRTKPFSGGRGHEILDTLLADLEIETDHTRNPNDISHIG